MKQLPLSQLHKLSETCKEAKEFLLKHMIGEFVSKYKVEFELDGIPKLPNTLLGQSWRVRAGNANMWHSKVLKVLGPNKPIAPCKVAKLCLTRISSQEPDYDGLVGSFKPIVDALVKVGVLENDKPSNIGGSEYFWEKGKPGKGKIKIKVEEQ